jgi:DNA-directed RNA polymerase specialized sigma24 family protein
MENAIGYLYVVGRDLGRRRRQRWRVVFPAVAEQRLPWVEPGLSAALSILSERERTVVVLLHGYGWVMSEVATTLGISKGSVQTYSNRGMGKLRRKLGAER